MDPGIGVQRRIRCGLRSWVRDCPSGKRTSGEKLPAHMAQLSQIYPRIFVLLINPISIHIICTSLVKFTSHFGIPLGTLPGSGNYLFSPRKFFSVPLSQHYACAMTFNMASGQGPGYWENIMDPVGTRSWTRLGPGHGRMMKTLHCFTSISLSTLC